MDVYPSQRGWIEIICGPMFAGKSEELLRRVRRELYAGRSAIIFTKDSRYKHDEISTHGGVLFPSEITKYIDTTDNIYDLTFDKEVIAFDEGQFFDADLFSICYTLSKKGKRIIVSGLDMDYLEQPFENMSLLMGIAEYVTKLTAVCVTIGCGNPANRSYRTVSVSDRQLQGAYDKYVPLCRKCYYDKKEN